MNIVKGTLLAALIALPVAGFAESDTNITYKASVALGATYKSGNSDKSLFTMDLKGNRYSPKNDWINSLYAEYGKTGTTTTPKTQSEGKARGQSDWKHKFSGKNFYGGVFGEALTDAIKQTRFRGKLGPNLGYYWINKETHKFDTSFGINYVYERKADFTIPPAAVGYESERDYGEWRFAANYLVNLSETANFYLNMEYSANLEDSNDGNGLLVTGVKSQLKERLAVFLELRDEYDNIPDAPGVEHNDVTVLAGLSYDFM